jgi:hypothetical protein
MKYSDAGGTFQEIKDLYTPENVSNINTVGYNRYTVRFGPDNSGNPIIIANGVGKYALEYTAKVFVRDDYSGQVITITNDCILDIYTGTSAEPDITEPRYKDNHKEYINTKLMRHNVLVR